MELSGVSTLLLGRIIVVWECIIRMIKKVLTSVLRQQGLDDEGFQKCKMEAMLNDGSITKLSEDPNELEGNHLLVMKEKAVLPPGLFEKSDLYTRRRWKQIQCIADFFWKRWVHEYLPWWKNGKNGRKNEGSCQGMLSSLWTIQYHVDHGCLEEYWKPFLFKKGLVCSIQLQTKTNVIERPVTKVCLLCEATDEWMIYCI